MKQDEYIDRLVKHAIETSDPMTDNVKDALPVIFQDISDRLAAWCRGEGEVDDIPTPLMMCACTDCRVGVAGDYLRELGYGGEYGFSNIFTREDDPPMSAKLGPERKARLLTELQAALKVKEARLKRELAEKVANL
jgi:hypothetical protein